MSTTRTSPTFSIPRDSSQHHPTTTASTNAVPIIPWTPSRSTCIFTTVSMSHARSHFGKNSKRCWKDGTDRLHLTMSPQAYAVSASHGTPTTHVHWTRVPTPRNSYIPLEWTSCPQPSHHQHPHSVTSPQTICLSTKPDL